MRIVHSGSCNMLAGGPALSTWLTIKGLRDINVDANLIMCPFTSGKIISNDLHPFFSGPQRFGTIAYASGFSKTLDKIGEVDLYHVQGVWMMYGTQMARYAKQHGKPYVITLRGMLYPQAFEHHSLQKKISMILYIGKTLREAAVVQATCVEEMQHYRNLGFKNPVALIPNPIEVPEKHVIHSLPTNVFRIGYLGRIHTRKRVERLIYALDYLLKNGKDNCELLVIGGGDKKYEMFLKSEVKRLGLEDKVRFTGFISGQKKKDAINSLSILAVPSDFENFGNIVTEALVHGVPVIASTGMPWQELPKYECGWWVANDQDTINKTIEEAHGLTPDKLIEMGKNGQALMKNNYSVEALALKMRSLYNWILGKEPKPDFVYD